MLSEPEHEMYLENVSDEACKTSDGISWKLSFEVLGARVDLLIRRAIPETSGSQVIPSVLQRGVACSATTTQACMTALDIKY